MCSNLTLLTRNNASNLVPCGKCEECLDTKQLNLYSRLLLEYAFAVKRGGYAIYITLTHNDEHLPKYRGYYVEDSPTLQGASLYRPFVCTDSDYCSGSSAVVACAGIPVALPSDISVYLHRVKDRLRRLLKPVTPEWREAVSSVKSCFVSEFGQDPHGTHRPHWHGVICVSSPHINRFDMLDIVKTSWTGYTVKRGISSVTVPCMGFVSPGKNSLGQPDYFVSSVDALRYVAKYVSKDICEDVYLSSLHPEKAAHLSRFERQHVAHTYSRAISSQMVCTPRFGYGVAADWLDVLHDKVPKSYDRNLTLNTDLTFSYVNSKGRLSRIPISSQLARRMFGYYSSQMVDATLRHKVDKVRRTRYICEDTAVLEVLARRICDVANAENARYDDFVSSLRSHGDAYRWYTANSFGISYDELFNLVSRNRQRCVEYYMYTLPSVCLDSDPVCSYVQYFLAAHDVWRSNYRKSFEDVTGLPSYVSDSELHLSMFFYRSYRNWLSRRNCAELHLRNETYSQLRSYFLSNR